MSWILFEHHVSGSRVPRCWHLPRDESHPLDYDRLDAASCEGAAFCGAPDDSFRF